MLHGVRARAQARRSKLAYLEEGLHHAKPVSQVEVSANRRGLLYLAWCLARLSAAYLLTPPAPHKGTWAPGGGKSVPGAVGCFHALSVLLWCSHSFSYITVTFKIYCHLGYMCLYARVYVHPINVEAMELRFLGTVSQHVHAGNQTQVLCKGNKYS